MTFFKHDEPGWHVHEDKRTTATAVRVPSSPATAKDAFLHCAGLTVDA